MGSVDGDGRGSGRHGPTMPEPDELRHRNAASTGNPDHSVIRGNPWMTSPVGTSVTTISLRLQNPNRRDGTVHVVDDDDITPIR